MKDGGRSMKVKIVNKFNGLGRTLTGKIFDAVKTNYDYIINCDGIRFLLSADDVEVIEDPKEVKSCDNCKHNNNVTNCYKDVGACNNNDKWTSKVADEKPVEELQDHIVEPNKKVKKLKLKMSIEMLNARAKCEVLDEVLSFKDDYFY